MFESLLVLIPLALIAATVFLVVLPSIRRIGPTEVGLVTKRFSISKMGGDNPIAFNGEAGYQADLLMPGLRWKLNLLYAVEKHPWVQVPAGEIGVVIAQIGAQLPAGAKSARYQESYGHFTDLATFVKDGGEKGVQRPVLPPGSLLPIHPVAFLVITKGQVYGVPISEDLVVKASREGGLTFKDFALDREEQLEVVRIEPRPDDYGKMVDTIGIVTTFEGLSLKDGDIASRLGGYTDIETLENSNESDMKLIESILASRNHIHASYQDFQKFLDEGGRIGLQHDPILYGAYTLNPFLVSVEIVPMLVVQQGEVAVIKGYVGLPTQDTSGADFKFGSLVKPGHRGIWEEPLRTGKYPLNPRIYQAEIVPTSILTLNWANAVSHAHDLDRNLCQIVAKSCEGFVFKIDLQVQIHVPDTKGPKVISTVGTMQNLVNEVLQAAVGNHFRDTLQAMAAVEFIQKRQVVQVKALEHITEQLKLYKVETLGVYIQDVELPVELVKVLSEREIAKQQASTFSQQRSAQAERVTLEQTKGTADMQTELARSQVTVEIERQKADAKKAAAEGDAAAIERLGSAKSRARQAEAEGEASYLQKTGDAKGAEVRSVGLAQAEAFAKQQEAIGPQATALLNLAKALSEVARNLDVPIVPTTLISSNGSSGTLDGALASLMGFLNRGAVGPEEAAVPVAPKRPKRSQPGKAAAKESE